MTKSKFFLAIVSVALCVFEATAAGPDRAVGNPLERGGMYQSFKNITLPFDANIVNTLFQDEQGMMWFGTRRGLFSYNGHDIHNHLSDLTTEANFILCILQISPDLLCVGTNYGLLTFNLRKERYETVYPELGALKAIRSLAMFNGRLWIGTRDEGLYSFDPGTGELERAFPEGSDGTAVFALQPAGDRLFVGSYEGLGHYDAASGLMTSVKFAGEERLTVNALLWDDWNQAMWVGTETSLYRYDLAGGTLEPVPEIGRNSVKTLADDSRGNLLVGTDNGLYVFDPGTRNVTHIVHDSGNARSIGNDVLWNILCDRSQNVWIATDRGVSMTRIDDSYRFLHLSEIVRTRDGNLFTCLNVDGRGDSWLGGENGLIRVTADSSRVDWFRANDRDFPLRHNHIRRIYEDRDGDIWIATDGSVARFDRPSGRFVYYSLQDRERNRDANWAYDIYEDPHGRLWVATYLGGLFVLDKRKMLSAGPGRPFTEFVHVFDGDNGLSNSIFRIFPDGRGRLWANTQTGLGCIDMETFEVSMKDVPMDNMVMGDGRIYYSSEGSLFFYDIARDKTGRLPFSAPGGQIHALVWADGRLWFSATNGIHCLDVASGRVRCVSTSRNYIQAGLYLREAGEILWGGEDCICFCPVDRESEDRGYASVFITGISRDDVHLMPGVDYVGDSPRFGTALKLGKRGNVTLELSTFIYSTEDDGDFYYRLNRKDEWHNLERGQNHINFVEPGGGDYQISLCGANPAEDAYALVTGYTLTVPYPWYSCRAARCLYCLFLLAAVALVYRMIQRRERRRYELRQKEEMLALANMKMDFFVNISHELKTPLSLIIAPLSKMISETSDAGQKKALQFVHRNALRLNALIYKVLDFKQIEYESENTLIRSSVELHSLLENIVSTFASAAMEKGVRLSFSPQADSVWLNLDILKIESVFINLISNALKYAPEGSGTVDVSLWKTGETVSVTVADNGPGIREEELPLVFIRFFRGRNRAVGTKGTGIGLYLVKKFVELHSGSVELRNDGGLTVKVTLPATGENAMVSEGPVREEELQPEGDPDEEVLLIIDDNRELVAFLAEALSPQYRCMKAYNGREGIQAVRERMPDLIIVDQMMPEMDGFEFTRAVRHNYPTAAIPIIMLTAKDDTDSELKSIRAGIDAFIAKPFDLKKLILRVAQLLSRQQSLERAVRIEAIATPEFGTAGEKGSADEILMKKISAAIEENMQDENFSVAALARMTGVEPKQLYRKIRQMTGLSPVNYVRKLRMRKAALLLEQHKFTVSEVMYLVGYANASYFTKSFAQEFGVTPRQYLNDSRQKE